LYHYPEPLKKHDSAEKKRERKGKKAELVTSDQLKRKRKRRRIKFIICYLSFFQKRSSLRAKRGKEREKKKGVPSHPLRRGEKKTPYSLCRNQIRICNLSSLLKGTRKGRKRKKRKERRRAASPKNP